MEQTCLKILNSLRYPNGLFAASAKDVNTGYNLCWIRDNIYSTLGFEAVHNFKEAVRTYHALLDILLKHEYKIDWAIREKPKHKHQYIHARYNPATMEEIWDDWGNKQNDAIGALLFKIGELEEKGVRVIRDENDSRIVQKLVLYLNSIEFWQDADNGMWENEEEIHASSVGACVAGLKKIRKVIDIDQKLIDDMMNKGMLTLRMLLPRESRSKHTDLALLSLIYPYNIVEESVAQRILENVEAFLVRDKGVVRYAGDWYYANEEKKEAQWCMGFPWLAIIYKLRGRKDKYAEYMRKASVIMTPEGALPELYYANSTKYNENSPLGWAQALYLMGLKT